MVNVISEVSKEKILDLLDEKKRVDDRSFTDYRNISIKTDYISKAEGSALVSMDGTTVVAGVKAKVSTPFSNTPDEGILITSTELLTIANRNFEYGPPNKYAVEVSRVVDRAIRQAPLIDLKDLCIIEDSKVWKIHLDLYIIDYDGNIMDAVCLAAVCALLTTKLPTVTSVNGELTVDDKNKIDLPIKNKTVICSVTNINDYLVVDPIYIEETLSDASISIGFREDGSICAIQKCGLDSMTVDEVKNSMEIARSQSEKLFTLINDIK